MKPKKQARSVSDDLFRMRLEQMLDQRHAVPTGWECGVGSG